jgi:Ca-activated chloride channel family protein
MLEDFHFLRPLFLIAFIPLAVLVHFWIKRTHGTSNWLSAINSELLSVLIEDGAKRSGKQIKAFLLGALLIAIMGLAGPTWEKLPQNVEQKNDALVIALDLSLSMLSEDLKPSRIVKAKQKVIDILRSRNEGLTGLVAYAGDAHSVVPLTDDNATIENLLVALDPTMMPVFGSKPEHAIKLAFELFSNAGMQEGRILIISDGIDSIKSISKFRNTAFPISVIGVGTAKGGPIPIDRPGQPRAFLKDTNNQPLIVKLEENNLAQVANQSFGRYAKLSLNEQDIYSVLSTPLPTQDPSIEVEREFDMWSDQGHWAALVLLPFLLAGFRRGLLACLPLALILQAMPIPIQAETASAANAGGSTADIQTQKLTESLGELWQKAWQRDDQRGYKALISGDSATAAGIFRDPEWKATADYKNGEWQNALSGFDELRGGGNQSTLQKQFNAAYNSGNTLAQLGEYDKAIDAYDEALNVDPMDDDAKFNRALIENLKKQQQQQEQEKQNEGEEDQQNQEGEDSSQDNQQRSQEQEQEQQEDGEPTDPTRPSEEQTQDPRQETDRQESEEQSIANRDEKQEALEQWLRRVPDNPGGLLKRKFDYETKQRLRQGDYSNQQSEKIW